MLIESIYYMTGIRQLGLEFLVTLAEQRAGMVRKVPSFVANIIPVVLNFMLDIEDDPEWNTNDVRIFYVVELIFMEKVQWNKTFMCHTLG